MRRHVRLVNDLDHVLLMGIRKHLGSVLVGVIASPQGRSQEVVLVGELALVVGLLEVALVALAERVLLRLVLVSLRQSLLLGMHGHLLQVVRAGSGRGVLVAVELVGGDVTIDCVHLALAIRHSHARGSLRPTDLNEASRGVLRLRLVGRASLTLVLGRLRLAARGSHIEPGQVERLVEEGSHHVVAVLIRNSGLSVFEARVLLVTALALGHHVLHVVRNHITLRGRRRSVVGHPVARAPVNHDVALTVQTLSGTVALHVH